MTRMEEVVQVCIKFDEGYFSLNDLVKLIDTLMPKEWREMSNEEKMEALIQFFRAVKGGMIKPDCTLVLFCPRLAVLIPYFIENRKWRPVPKKRYSKTVRIVNPAFSLLFKAFLLLVFFLSPPFALFLRDKVLTSVNQLTSDRVMDVCERMDQKRYECGLKELVEFN